MWIDVTGLMLKGMGMATVDLLKVPEVAADPQRYIERLNAVSSIPQIDLHIEQVTGEDKTVDVVVDIFNRVNSGGTKLSKGDLALARICASWPAARDELKSRLEKWRDAGYHFRLEWLLRNVNAILTGRAEFSALKDVDTKTFAAGLDRAEKAVDASLMMIASRLGLDNSAVLGGSAAIPLIARYWAERGGKPLDHRERDRLLFWYVHTFLWGRYAGSTESVLNQDLTRIEELDGGLERLIEQLRSNRGDPAEAPMISRPGAAAPASIRCCTCSRACAARATGEAASSCPATCSARAASSICITSFPRACSTSTATRGPR